MSANLVTASESRPCVTVVITCRERFQLTEAAIDSVVRHTRMPMRLLFLDICSPDWLREKIARRANEWGLETVQIGRAHV